MSEHGVNSAVKLETFRKNVEVLSDLVGQGEVGGEIGRVEADCKCGESVVVSSECAVTISQNPNCTVVKALNLDVYDQSEQLNFLYLKHIVTKLFLTGAYCNDTLHTLAFPVLEHVGDIEITYNDLITSLTFPELFSVDEKIEIFSNDNISILHFPKLQNTRYFLLSALSTLETLTLPALTAVGQLDFVENPKLKDIFLPVLQKTSHLTFWGNDGEHLQVHLNKNDISRIEAVSFFDFAKFVAIN